jgi:hypothetical protein
LSGVGDDAYIVMAGFGTALNVKRSSAAFNCVSAGSSLIRKSDREGARVWLQ